MNPEYEASQVADESAPASETPAWAAPAKMNPDYKPAEAGGDAAAPAPASESESAAPTQAADESAPSPTGGNATTEYFGGSTAPANPAWDAPATMNPEYSKDESATPAPSESASPAAEAPATQPAEEAAPPATGGKATTDYYGGSPAPANPAWDAPATMNPDYNAAAPAAGSGEANAPASSAVACQETVTTNAESVSVHFNEDSASISQDSQAALKSLAEALAACSGVTVEVHGYTDNVGTVSSNKVLSLLRAKKVADFLASSGVDASKLSTTGHGPDSPIGDNSTAEGRHKNRRVELVVSGQ
jgi:outer membrane protein OmpA-like peptidoglycan-associated protein